VSHDLIELRNLVLTADLIVRSAMLRHESRGLHFSRDFPDALPVVGNTILNPRPGLVCPGVCEVLMPEM
jgi:L-aspartate oxidase